MHVGQFQVPFVGRRYLSRLCHAAHVLRQRPPGNLEKAIGLLQRADAIEAGPRQLQLTPRQLAPKISELSLGEIEVQGRRQFGTPTWEQLRGLSCRHGCGRASQDEERPKVRVLAVRENPGNGKASIFSQVFCPGCLVHNFLDRELHSRRPGHSHYDVW